LCRDKGDLDPGEDPDDAYVDAEGAADIRDLVRCLPKRTSGGNGRADRYFLDMPSVANLFLTDEIALQLILGNGTINSALAEATGLEVDRVIDLARAKIDARKGPASALANKIRVLPDGMTRKPARIDPEVLRGMIDAVTRNRVVEFDYVSSAGRASRKTMAPGGLAIKDGTVYFLGFKGIRSTPEAALPLHRMSKVHVSAKVHHGNFDLDGWLEKTGQLNHPMDDPDKTIELELMVNPNSIWHFVERTIGYDQVITPPTEPGEWYHLKVTTKRWYILTSFISSFGPAVKLLGPAEALEGDQGLKKWVYEMAKIYQFTS
jgi:predicted DNA-binding transcriptional regulator YafY